MDSAIRSQGVLPPEQRRGVLVVVDEMQALPGVDYGGMLSELGKFGASFILATQSLGKLDEISDTLRDTLLANVSCLVAFQVSAKDAQELVGELDRERVGEEDLASLPSHHCYVRATVDGRREPTYYMELRPPEPGDLANRAADQGRRLRLHHAGGGPWPGWRPRRTCGSRATGTAWNGRTRRTTETRPPAASRPSPPERPHGSGGKADANKGKGKSNRSRNRRRGEGGVRQEPEQEAEAA